jgi:hypothetical protein
MNLHFSLPTQRGRRVRIVVAGAIAGVVFPLTVAAL